MLTKKLDKKYADFGFVCIKIHVSRYLYVYANVQTYACSRPKMALDADRV